MQDVRTYWYRQERNFGDSLVPLLLERYAGVRARWSPPEAADLFTGGSVLQLVPTWSRATLAGVGLIAGRERGLPSARVLALRGPLTAALVGAPDGVVLADPGLLVGLTAPSRPRSGTGIIPHYVDWELPHRFDGRVIDVHEEPDDFIEQVAGCRRVVSSSLHGIITADALGIPRRWEPHPGVKGDGFKFRDYAASLGTTIEPGVWLIAPADIVALKQQELLEVFRCIIP